VNADVLGRITATGALSGAGSGADAGAVVVEPRAVVHPEYADAVIRTPVLVRLDVADESAYEQECFGPISYLIATGSTDESIDVFRRTVIEHGAMTASVYSTSEAVIASMRAAALDAGVALSENLTGQVFVNQSAAFSDFHGTGANPSANSTLTDGAFVASRFRVVQSRRHI
jgi:acyl-CoA reductase-like NAD-dependent aldehyde dehydrogenase